MTSPHVVIMAGGTGGHIYPALAVAQELIHKGATVSWLGTQKGLEAQLVPNAGIDIDFITIEGVRGKGWKSLLKAPWLLAKAIGQARAFMKSRNARAILGFGGFVAGPGGVAAKLCGLPLIIHEQNAIAGTTNKLLAKIANRIFCAFPKVFDNAVVVGNPVRKEIVNLPKPQDRQQFKVPEAANNKELEPAAFKLLILGGSLGASALNALVPQALAQMADYSSADLQVVHQCGKKNVEQTSAAYKQAGLGLDSGRYKILPYVEDMAAAYQQAHFVVCRAGALTVAELASAGCASLLVPYPHAIDDHQTHNAMWLVDAGAAKLCQQNELTVERLTEELTFAINNRAELLVMANKARELALIEAADQVAQECFEVMGRG